MMPRMYAFLLLAFLWTAPAGADSFRVSAPEFPESEMLTRLLKEVYGRLGHEISVVFRPAKRSLVEVNAGQSDAEMARVTGAEMEYPNLVRVSEPVLALSFSAIVNARSKHWLSAWEEIRKHRIGYPRGYQIMNIRTRGLNATKASDPVVVARMVKGGRIDVGLLVTSDAERLAADLGGLVVLTPPMETVTLYHYVNVKHRRLVPAMEKILIELNDSGRTREIFYPKN